MILQAVWRQNELILALQAKILEMAEIEAGLQLTMHDLQKGVRAFQKTSNKVNNMDAMLKVNIPILNHMNKTVDVHGEAITRVSTELARRSSSCSRERQGLPYPSRIEDCETLLRPPMRC